MATGFGLRLARKIGGGDPVIEPFVVAAGDATALFKGDVVEFTATAAYDAATQLPTITRATTGHVLLGVVVGFDPDPTAPYSNSRAASTRRVVHVCTDRNAVYQVQEDTLGAPVTAAEAGARLNANIIVAAGSTATGLSGTMLDSSSRTASAADLKIIGVARTDDGNVAALAAGAIYEVTILAPANISTDSLT